MKTPKITPRGKQILVQPDGESSRESEYGIVTPDNIEEETKAFGTVIAVGADIVDVKVGQRVIYGAFAGEQISFKDSAKDIDFVLLFDEDVLAFIEDTCDTVTD